MLTTMRIFYWKDAFNLSPRISVVFRAAPKGNIPLVRGERRHRRDVSFRRIKTRISPKPSRLPLLVLSGLGDVVRPSFSTTVCAHAFSFQTRKINRTVQENGLHGREHAPDGADSGAARRRPVCFPR